MEHIYINERLNEIIRSYIPEGVKAVPFLMDLLNLSKESAYRRLRNEISYTMQEATVLGLKLGFSFDEIFDNINSRGKAYFSFSTRKGVSPADNYIELMKSTIKAFYSVSDNQCAKAYYAGNKVPIATMLNFKMLSKLNYIKWIHQTHNLAINSKFSDIQLPAQVDNIHKEYIGIHERLKEITIIIDDNIIQAIINTIKFYYRIYLIGDDEILEMKKELFGILDRLEYIARTGKSQQNVDNVLYLSDLHIESNIVLLEFDEGMSLHLLSSGMNPIATTSPKVCEDQKKWINSLLKFSILITRSNEILQTEFFMKQRNLINSQFAQLLGTSIQ